MPTIKCRRCCRREGAGMSKRRCPKGTMLLNRYLNAQRYDNRGESMAEMARVRMFQERERRAEKAWKNHKQNCRVCMGVKNV